MEISLLKFLKYTSWAGIIAIFINTAIRFGGSNDLVENFGGASRDMIANIIFLGMFITLWIYSLRTERKKHKELKARKLRNNNFI